MKYLYILERLFIYMLTKLLIVSPAGEAAIREEPERSDRELILAKGEKNIDNSCPLKSGSRPGSRKTFAGFLSFSSVSRCR